MKISLFTFFLLFLNIAYAQNTAYKQIDFSAGINYNLDQATDGFTQRQKFPGFESSLGYSKKTNTSNFLTLYELAFNINKPDIETLYNLNPSIDSISILGYYWSAAFNLGEVLQYDKNTSYWRCGLTCGAGIRNYPEEILYEFNTGSPPDIIQAYPIIAFDLNLKLFAAYAYKLSEKTFIGLNCNTKIEFPLTKRNVRLYNEYFSDVYDVNESPFLSFYVVVTYSYRFNLQKED